MALTICQRLNGWVRILWLYELDVNWDLDSLMIKITHSFISFFTYDSSIHLYVMKLLFIIMCPPAILIYILQLWILFVIQWINFYIVFISVNKQQPHTRRGIIHVIVLKNLKTKIASYSNFRYYNFMISW